MLDLECKEQEQQDLEKTSRLLKEEILAFAEHNNSPFYRDDLEYAVWLRKQIELDGALLHLLRRGEITVRDLNREDTALTTLGPKTS